ncbi:golgin subfamily A member 6-like protein 22 [Rana temporaria]|uniref:golgin subfamily A member 6-like protein 22 n=1 Tax=Rana temporaria TaxID=8407 RepID=UPI001AADB5B0|nr:golgin subfamily A member 6-like protein 22 [Rana temporaria]
MDLKVTLEKTVDGNSTLDENDIPDHSAVTESDVSQARNYVMEKCIENTQDQQSSIINDRKFIVFESELDKLLTKLICPTEDCFYIIRSLDKVIVGSLLKVYGTCPDHHHQIIWQSQPNIANFASGNVLPSSSSIVCSGFSFTKAKEMLDLNENLIGIIDEVKEEEEMYVIGDQQLKEEVGMMDKVKEEESSQDISTDGSSNGNPPKRGPLPLYPRDSTQVNIKEEIKEEDNEEAEFRKGPKKRYQDTMEESSSYRNQPERCSRPLNGNPPERGPLPLYPRDSTQVNIKEDIKEEEDDVMEEAEFRKDHTYKENDQGEELKVIKVEDKEEEERLVSGDQQSMEEGEMIMESKQEESSLHLDTRPFHTCGPLPGEKRQCLERRDSAWREETVKMARDVSHERLIQLVHVRPALWDKRSAEYSDRNTISVKWEEIFKEVTPNWLSLSSKQRRIRGDKIITRWRSLRDRYRRELKEEAKESRSRAGSSQKKKSPFFEMLDFLRSVMDLRSTTSKISETEEEGNAEDTQQAPEEEMGFGDNQPGPEENPSSHQPGPEENLSSQSAATATLQRQRVPIRSVGATASKGSKRRGKKKT